MPVGKADGDATRQLLAGRKIARGSFRTIDEVPGDGAPADCAAADLASVQVSRWDAVGNWPQIRPDGIHEEGGFRGKCDGGIPEEIFASVGKPLAGAFIGIKPGVDGVAAGIVGERGWS